MSDPVAEFHVWFEDAKRAGEGEPSAMALATADLRGNPSVRMVLLKHADAAGFVFYTNLGSPKALALSANPRAELCFYWPRLERQVRITGHVDRVSDTEADAYFASRPRLSQLGAWASKQSQPMTGYYDLEQACAAQALRFPFGAVPRPRFWSGFRVVHQQVEFWQQKPFRRHERQLFTRVDGAWQKQWLFP